jgi:plastocyanin
MRSRRQFAATIGLGILGWPLGAHTAAKGLITGTTVTRGPKERALRDHSGTVVYLEGVRGSLPSGQSHEIRQIDQRFVPAISVVTVGTTLTFPNDDRIYHNVFSNSPAAEFDLGSYDRGETRSVRLKRPGQVEVYCNIHQAMRATVLVLETPYFARTDMNGGFAIANVPPGTHRYVVWRRDAKPVSGKIRVVADAPAYVELTIPDGQPQRHRKKTGHVHDDY